MKKLLLAIVLISNVFGDTIIQSSFAGRLSIKDVKFIKVENSMVIYEFNGKEQSLNCSKVIQILDNDGNYIEYDCSIAFVAAPKNSRNQSFRESWSYSEPKDPFKSGMLSAIVPSGGHFYNAQYSKGWRYLFGVPMLYLTGSLIAANNSDKNDENGVGVGVLIQFSALILHFYNVYDAIISSNNINKEYYDKYLENKHKEEEPN